MREIDTNIGLLKVTEATMGDIDKYLAQHGFGYNSFETKIFEDHKKFDKAVLDIVGIILKQNKSELSPKDIGVKSQKKIWDAFFKENYGNEEDKNLQNTGSTSTQKTEPVSKGSAETAKS